MDIPIAEIVTAVGGLGLGGFGTHLWAQRNRRQDRKEEKQDDKQTDLLVRQENITTRLEVLAPIVEKVAEEQRALDKRLTITEHRQEKTEKDLNGLGRKVSAITTNGGFQ